MTATRTLVVSCPDWPVTAAGVPADIAAAVVFANRVVAASVAARADGVRVGLRRREAQSRCPGLVVIERDPGREARAFEPVVMAVETFGPRVEVSHPGVCAIPTRGPARYFGGEEALVDLIGVAVSDAIAGLVPVATTSRDCPYWGVGVADGRFAATLAAGRGLIVAPAQSAAFLADFPVAVLERAELTDLLARLGIRALGQLAALPTADVLARFGPEGAVAQRLAQGLDERPLDGRDPPPDLIASVELDPPVDRVDTAAFAARTLAQDLHERLVRLGLACHRVRIEAETEHGEHLSRLWCHDGPFLPADIAERVRWQLDGWLSGTAAARPTAGLTLLRLLPDEVVPDQGRQLGFWGGEAGVDERTARALARVQGLLGPEAVVTAVLGGGRSPDEQVRLVPWGDPRTEGAPESTARTGDRAEKTAPPWPGRVPPPSPAIVHTRSLVAEVVDGDGRAIEVTGRGLVSAVPARLSVAAGPWIEVTAWAGPWPADERWWDPAAHRRRARLQVVLADGSAHLLALEAGCWGVEATYD
ncbi:MAG: DNA polymerase Y family protein [Actinobacteria bacterium]|nr:MAG: DNA polymerase Y family protein [Actinomycetota bacterium]